MSDQLQDKRRKDFFIESNSIFELGLSKHALLVRLYLVRCADGNEQAFPSLKTIASKCGMGRTSVTEALNELEKFNLITRVQRKKPGSDELTTTLYTLLDCSGSPYSGLGVVRPADEVVRIADGEQDSSKKTKFIKVSFGEYVKMKQFEYDELVERLGKDRVNTLIERINDGVGMYGYKYKDFYKVVLTWHKRDLEKQPQQQQVPFVPSAEETQKMLKRVREGGSSDALQRDSGDGSDWLTS